MRRFKFVLVLVVVAVLMATCFACAAPAPSAAPEQPTAEESKAPEAPASDAPAASTDAETPTEAPKTATDPDAELKKLDTMITQLGQNGEVPVNGNTITITDEQIAQVKEKKLTCALMMSASTNDWNLALRDGVKAQCEKLGIELVSITASEWDVARQTADVESLIALKPDFIIAVPIDQAANAAAFQKAAAAGIKIVFSFNPCDGMEAGKDYITCVTPDNMGNGARAVHFLAKELGGKGKIGLIYYDTPFYSTQSRYYEAKKVLQEKYPDIEIVAEQGFDEADAMKAGEEIATAMLTKNPDLKAIWTIWDVPAEGAMAAAKALGRDKDLKIGTIDFGKNVSVAMLKDEMIVGIGADAPFDAGVVASNCAALSALGQEVPPFIAIQAHCIDKTNAIDMWPEIFHSDTPQEMLDAAK